MKPYDIGSNSSTMSDVNLSNRYDGLNVDVNADIQPVNVNKQVSKKQQKITPIVLKKSTYNELKSIAAECDIAFNCKVNANGILVYVTKIEDYKKLQSVFVAKNKEFFAYELEESKMVKFILTGLPNLPVDEIKTGLQAHEIIPTEIKPLYFKNKKYSDHQVYIVYFNKKDMRLSKLRSIKYLCHVAVRWAYYTKRNNITQCYRCQHFGHGTRQCHLPERCVRCGDNHEVSNCQHPTRCSKCKKQGHSAKLCQTQDISSDNETVSKEVSISTDTFIKCANCGGNHTASFRMCPKRLEYINNRKKANICSFVILKLH